MLLHVDEKDPRPIYLQLVAQVKEQIRKGVVRSGEELPSVREVANALGINLHTAHRAYQVLREQDVIVVRLGRRPRVAALREEPAGREEIQRRLGRRLEDLITEAFHMGLSPRDFRSLVEQVLRAGKGDR